MSNALVRRTLQTEGVVCLPLGVLDGEVVFRGGYPAREELVRMLALAEEVGDAARHRASDTRYLFFTGKGGVGKTSLATATAVALADRGRVCCSCRPIRRRISGRCSSATSATPSPPFPRYPACPHAQHRSGGCRECVSRACRRSGARCAAQRCRAADGRAALGRLHDGDRGVRRVHEAADRRGDRARRTITSCSTPRRPATRSACCSSSGVEQLHRRQSGRRVLPRPDVRTRGTARRSTPPP
jgi:hypothetical protein